MIMIYFKIFNSFSVQHRVSQSKFKLKFKFQYTPKHEVGRWY